MAQRKCRSRFFQPVLKKKMWRISKPNKQVNINKQSDGSSLNPFWCYTGRLLRSMRSAYPRRSLTLVTIKNRRGHSLLPTFLTAKTS